VAAECIGNVVILPPVPKEDARRFLAAAEAAGLRDLRGHPERGGVRISLYNGLADAAVEALAAFLARFARATVPARAVPAGTGVLA